VPGVPAGRPPGVPSKAGGQFGANRYAPKLQKAPPKPKQKMLGNFLFRSVFFIAFALTAYEINGPSISFGLIGLMLLGVVLIDLVMWKCGSCGRYLGISPWPGQRCKKCHVRFF
jgi:hypothetical protein